MTAIVCLRSLSTALKFNFCDDPGRRTRCFITTQTATIPLANPNGVMEIYQFSEWNLSQMGFCPLSDLRNLHPPRCASARPVRLRPAGICRRQSGLRLDRPAPTIRTLGTLPSNTSSSPMATILHRAVRHVRRVQLPPPPHPAWVLLPGPLACSRTQARKCVGSPSTKFLSVSVRRTGTRFPFPPH